MNRDEALSRLARHSGELLKLGVRSLALSDSTARGEARPESDVDLVVELDRPIGPLARLQRQIEEWVGAPVDLVPSDSIKPAVREAILREAVRGA